MVVGNALVTSLGFEDSSWKYLVYIFPANLGQGIVYPGILFTSLATFDHAGKMSRAERFGAVRVAHRLFLDHAVSASTTYLIRSLGTVYGVAITSAIVQTTLSVRLPDALGEIEDKWRVRPFSLQHEMMYRYKTGNTQDTYMLTGCRLLTRSDTLCPPSRHSRQMCSSKRGSCSTTGFATRLRLQRPSLLLPSVLLSWLEQRGFAAPNNVLVGRGRLWGLGGFKSAQAIRWWVCRSSRLVGEKYRKEKVKGDASPPIALTYSCLPVLLSTASRQGHSLRPTLRPGTGRKRLHAQLQSTKKPPTQDPCIHRPCAASDATKQHNHHRGWPGKLVFRISALFVEDSCWSIAAKQPAVTMSYHRQLPGFSMQPARHPASCVVVSGPQDHGRA